MLQQNNVHLVKLYCTRYTFDNFYSDTIIISYLSSNYRPLRNVCTYQCSLPCNYSLAISTCEVFVAFVFKCHVTDQEKLFTGSNVIFSYETRFQLYQRQETVRPRRTINCERAAKAVFRGADCTRDARAFTLNVINTEADQHYSGSARLPPRRD